jgi:hypothetical protein
MRTIIVLLAMVSLIMMSGSIGYAQNFRAECTLDYLKPSMPLPGDETYGEKVEKLIQKYIKPIKLGMTDKEVYHLTGEPTIINRTGGKWGVHEQWVIDMPIVGNKYHPLYKTLYLYFENGILISWQN